jgi:response regulator RpfG family c-di-GMP phosphodiesterase
MDKDKIYLEEEDFNLDFLADERESAEKVSVSAAYKVMIVDDDIEVHTTTKMILKDFSFQGRKLEFIDAYSGKEASDLMRRHNDVALILLDVVMEANHSGLEFVEFVRKELKNIFVRIILRTGQPGQAPEGKIIVDYDINDYLLKTDITVQRLYTSLYQALRSYRDIVYIDNNRRGLEKIIKSSSEMFIKGSMQEFFDCILNELLGFRHDRSSVCFRLKARDNGLAFLSNNNYGIIISATGDYKKFIGQNIGSIERLSYIYQYVQEMEQAETSEVLSIAGGFLVWKKSSNNVASFIFIESDIKEYDLELIKVFLANYSLALDNYLISQQMLRTQIEIIYTLGDLIESRSHETAYHVKRVSEISYFIGKKLNLSAEECTILRIASMVHDAGKITINDNILLKPAKLSPAEYEIVKEHTLVGHKIFSNSDLELLKKAADICLYHHEKYDGSGYPTGCGGKDIPLFARIVSIADVFDAITHKRCYKEAWNVEEAKAYLLKQKGVSFDPAVVDLFIDNLEEIVALCDQYPD